MFFYKRKNTNEVFAYDTEDDREKYGDKELVKMTQKEIDAHLNPPPPPISEILEHSKSDLRSLRAPMLDALSGIAGRAVRAGNDGLAAEADALAVLLLDITDDPTLNAATTYEEMQAAGVAAYKRIAATASPALSIVFKEITGA